MSETEALAIQLDDRGMVMDRRPQLRLEVVTKPNIMIARKEVDLHTSIMHQGNLPKEANMPPWDDRSILKPVVEHIPEEVDRLSLGLDLL